MEIRKGERWRCQNQACGGVLFVLSSSQLSNGSNPRCSCGSVMKKPYRRPEVSEHPLPDDERRRRVWSGEFGPDQSFAIRGRTREEAF